MKKRKKKPFILRAPLFVTLLAGAIVTGTLYLCGVVGPNASVKNPQVGATSAVESEAPEDSKTEDTELSEESGAEEGAAGDEEESSMIPEESLEEESSVIPGESSEENPEESSEESPEEESSEEEWKELTFTEVSPEYFSDALFIGDSRVDGLCANAPFPGADYYYKTSLTIFEMMNRSTEECEVDGYSDLRSILRHKQYGKVYICLGINDVLDPTDEWISTYWNAVQEIRAYQPNALIFVQGVMYVSASRMAAEPYFDSQMLNGRNQMLSEFANGRDIFYLDISTVYNDGGDNLPEEYTGDGVHLKPQYYGPWHDMFLGHGIVTEE